MPGAALEVAAERVEAWRVKFQDISIAYQDMTLKCTFSAGLASFPLFGRNIKTLFSSADKALYEAKQKGRNRVVIPQTES